MPNKQQLLEFAKKFSLCHFDQLKNDDSHGEPITIGDRHVVLSKKDFNNFCAIADEYELMERPQPVDEIERKALLWERLMRRMEKISADIASVSHNRVFATKCVSECEPSRLWQAGSYSGATLEEALTKSLENE